MLVPAIPDNEALRLRALHDRTLLDTPPEERFDRLTRLAKHVFGIRIALVSLVDAKRQWFKSRQGLEAGETGRDISFCGHAILSREIFEISDARLDPRFADNPLVTGPPNIRFYAGAPLNTSDGYRIGTLCIIDDRPRQLNDVDRKALRDLADCVEAEINQVSLEQKSRELKQFKGTLDRTLDCVFMFDAVNLNFFYVNEGALRQVGYSREEMMSMHPYDIKPEITMAEFHALIAPLLKGEKDSLTFETVHQHKNGQRVPVEIFLQYIAPIDESARFVAIVRDITERQAIESELRDSEQRFQAMVENAGDAIYIHDRYGKIHDVNQVACHQTGYTRDELRALAVAQLDAGVDFDTLRKTWDMGEADPAQYPLTLETAHRRKDGSVFPIEVRISLLPAERGYLFVAVVRDITERKQAEMVIRDREARVRAIVQTVVDGIVTIDEQGLVETFNPAAEQIFGYVQEEVVGRNIKMLMPEPYHSEHDGYLHNYVTTGKAKIIGIGREVTGRRKDGTTFPMELAVSEMQVQGARMFTGIVRDITERKRVDRMKNEFISTVSHELRTPLTAIRGSLGLITGGVLGELPEQAKAMLNIASNNTERLLMLINDILDIQKIEAGKMAFRFENVAIMPLLEKAVADLETYGNQHGVHFEITHRLDAAHVFADRERLMQVLANLMSNAAKFSPPDSRVEIAAAQHHDGRVRISITDYGSGVPEAFKARIFQPFTQSDSSDTRSKGGTGLGLAITRAIVERHGGQIGFISREGIGSTFYIELPEMRGGAENVTDQPRMLPASHRSCVLIVEDDPDVAALIQRMLTEVGFDSDIAYTAQQARQLLAEHEGRYRLMTLDLQLPDEDGIHLLESLRRDADTQNLPVVVVSVKADEVKRQLVGGALDIMDWLQKPIDVDRLTSVVRAVCGKGCIPRVLHVEDEPDVRTVVAAMLKTHCTLTSVASLEAARAVLANGAFDLVLLDIGLPDGSGLELIGAIEQLVPPPRIVIFSANDVSEEYAEKVSAVLVKSRTGNDELLRILLRGMRNV